MELESKQRYETINLLIKSATLLKLHTDSICTACRYLHQYFNYIENNPPKSDQYDPGIIVATTLYIGKIYCNNNSFN